MIREAILHIPMSEYAHALSETKVLIRLRAKKDDLSSCELHIGDRAFRGNPVKFTAIPMYKAYSSELFDWWEVTFDIPFRRICYYFTLRDGVESILYFSDQFHEQEVIERAEYYQLPYVHRADITHAPDWARDAIIYNIFPDSFATSKRHISLQSMDTTWRGEVSRGQLGGKIRGITENVAYLLELGVNCIYINPLFVAGEYHKYDLLDYYNVDPCFGSNEEFKEMVDVLHAHGIRVMIDGVFNHCGWHFFAFDDVVKNGEGSRYRDWFYHLEYPVIRPDTGETIPGYECFAYERKMPKLDTANPEVREYFCKVGQHWIREYGIDGWRLDVADEVDDGFWRAFHQACVEVNPDVFLIGEVWVNANHWLDGTMFHSAMNYDFRKYCRDFFALGKIDARRLEEGLTLMLTRYRKNLTEVQLNILDSHDVSRFLSLCDGDVKKLKLALLFQMAFVGIPCVFYGDEQGLSGVLEVEYRRPMTWDGDADLFAYYQQLIRMRIDKIPLRRGSFRVIHAEAGLLVFERHYEAEVLTFAINAGECSVVYDGEVVKAYGYRMKEGDLWV